MPISWTVLRELCHGLLPEAIPLEIRGFLTSSELPVITESQVRDIVDLGLNARRVAAATNATAGAGNNSQHASDPPHASGSQQTHKVLTSADTEVQSTQPIPEAGRSIPKSDATNKPTNPEAQKDHATLDQQPNSHTPRPSLQNEPLMKAPIPRACHSVRQDHQESEVNRQSASSRGQRAIQDNM